MNVLVSYGGQGSYVVANLAIVFLSVLLALVFNKYYTLILPVFYGEFIGIWLSGIYDSIINILSWIRGTAISDALSLAIIVVCILVGSAASTNNVLKASRYAASYNSAIRTFANYVEMIARNKILMMLLISDIIFYFIFDTYTAIHVRSAGTIDLNYIINAAVTLNFGSIAYVLGMSISQNNFVYFALLIILNCILIIILRNRKSNWMPLLYSPLLGFAIIGLYDGTLNIGTNMVERSTDYMVVSLAIIAGSIVFGLVIRMLNSNFAPSLMAPRPEKQIKKQRDGPAIKAQQRWHNLTVNDPEYEKIIIDLSRSTFYDGSVEYINHVNMLAKKYGVDQAGVMYDIWATKERLEQCES